MAKFYFKQAKNAHLKQTQTRGQAVNFFLLNQQFLLLKMNIKHCCTTLIIVFYFVQFEKIKCIKIHDP